MFPHSSCNIMIEYSSLFILSIVVVMSSMPDLSSTISNQWKQSKQTSYHSVFTLTHTVISDRCCLLDTAADRFAMILTKMDSDSVIYFIQCMHTLSWLAVQKPRSSSRKRETIVLRSIFVWRCWCLNFAHLMGLMLKSSQDWVYMQVVRVCLCTEISSRCSMGSVLDTQLMGVPWPTLALCHHAGIILFCGDNSDHGLLAAHLASYFRWPF